MNAVQAWCGGVIPAVPVPFRDPSTIDEVALDRYASWMTEQDIPAVAVGAHTGRGLHLSEQQRQTVVETWQRAGIDLVIGVGVPIETVLPSASTALFRAVVDATVAMTEWAQREGAAGVLVYPPTAFRAAPDVQERVVQLHEAIAAVGPATIAFYLYEAAGGIDYSDATLESVLAIEGVVGIKLATLDDPTRFQQVASLARAGGRLCITGEDRFLGRSWRMGADVALIGMAAACTDRMVELAQAHERGDGRFDQLSEAIDLFAAATFDAPVDGYVQRMLWALEADGVIAGPALDPFGPHLSADERTMVQTAVAALRRA